MEIGKLKGLVCCNKHCKTDIGIIDDQSTATEFDILWHDLEKAITALSSIAGTPAYREKKYSMSKRSSRRICSTPQKVSTPPGPSMFASLSSPEQAPDGSSSSIQSSAVCNQKEAVIVSVWLEHRQE